MGRITEILSARWDSVTLPSKMTEELRPFGTFDGRVDWRGLTIGSYEGLEVAANGVDLTGARFEGATVTCRLANSLLADVKVTDCDLTAASFDACSVVNVELSDSSLSYSKFKECSVNSLLLERCNVDSAKFRGGCVDRLSVSGGSAEKLAFETCRVFLLLATFRQGNLTFSDCEGLAIFEAKSIPHRLFNRSDKMTYCVSADVRSFEKKVKTYAWGVAEVVINPDDDLTRLDIKQNSIIMLRDQMAELGFGV